MASFVADGHSRKRKKKRADVGKTIDRVLRTHPFTDWIIVLKLMPADRIGGNLPDKNTAGQKKHSLTVCTERTQSGATLETARYNYRCS